MRSFLLILCVLILLLMGAIRLQGNLHHTIEGTVKSLSAVAHSILYDVEIQFEGERVVPEVELRELLPKDRTISWWMFNSSSVAKEISKHPLINTVKSQNCNSQELFSGWRCFRFSVEERKPSMVAEIEGVKWIVDSEGVFLRTLKRDALAFRSLDQGELPFVRGIAREQRSPELMSARLRYIGKALSVIETVLGRSITEVELDKRGEMHVQLERANFWVIFDESEAKFSNFRSRAERLKALLHELRGREHLISSIDLAFHKLGVVKLVEGAELGGSSQS